MINSNIPNFSSMSMVKAKVDLYKGSTLTETCTCGNVLSDFTVTREGDNSKFFGFGICHKLDVNLIDLYRVLTTEKINIGHTAEIGLGDGGDVWDAPYPTFYITEVKRDEKSNTITATAYDKLYWAGEYLFKDLELTAPYTLRQVAQAIATKLGLTLKISGVSSAFNLSYAEGANLEGTEDLRSILNAVAEVTQTIYYVTYNNELIFKRLDKSGEPVFSITKDDYYELNTKTPRTLTLICNTTELGDNVESSTGAEGAIQYIRNNPFLELRTDLVDLLDTAIATVGGTTITQFDCDWGGNYLLEIGDKLALTTEDGGTVESYLLSDTVKYAGTLNESSEWEYTDEQPETYANPTNIGDRINQTFAKVDKVNKEISLQASSIEENKENIGRLQISTTQINASVSSVEQQIVATDTKVDNGLTQTNDKVNSLSQEIETLTNEVNLKVSSEDVTILVSSSLEQGIDKITTTTKKYTFDDNGLDISSSDSEISTVITEDGMNIKKNNQDVLTANNKGVKAQDLHATTYLIIGENSRLEDWENRTACFWIGGNN